MGPVLFLVGLAGLLFGLGNLVRPLGRLRVNTRKQAGLVTVGSLVVMIMGGAFTPPPGDAPIPAASGTAIGPTPSTTSSTAGPTSTTTDLRTSTSPPATTTIHPPSIPRADVVFAGIGSGDSGDPGAPLPADADLATVASITDGDTLDVILGDGTVDTVRLIGTDSPEPGECFADEASLVLGILAPVGGQVGMTIDVSDRDQYDRLLRYLWVGGMSINEEMVRRGAAISRRYPPDTTMAERLDLAQSEARGQQLGLWEPDACGPDAGTEIVVARVEADAPGNDNENMNAEYVTIRNEGDIGVDLTGWGLRDESASHRYDFPTGFTLAAGATVTVYTGCGADDGTNLYWCSIGAVWNNDGDTALVVDQNGNVVHSLPYVPPTITTTSDSDTVTGGDCDPSYPDACIPPPPPDLDCGQIPYRRFTVVGSDPHGFDGNDDGVGCESS